MKHKFKFLAGAVLLCSALSVSSGFAGLQLVTDLNSAQGDVLDYRDSALPDDDPDFAFELGENSDGDGGGANPGFSPAFEILVEFVAYGSFVSDATTDLMGPAPDLKLRMTNLSLNVWTDLWFVADAGTTFTNYDGLTGTAPQAPSLLSFKIDAVGVNRPLFSESMTADGIFELGEVWEFVIQDLSSTAGPAAAFQSVGLGDGFSEIADGDDPSMGSILGIPDGELVPEPSRALLMLCGLVSLLVVRRRS